MAKSDKPPLFIDANTKASQRRAADPAHSAWVSANAGSGKTYVLSTRVIRLMLKGIPPDTILCLTYTKTAAAEMKNRVFERLAQWTLLDDTTLREEIAQLLNLDDISAVSRDMIDKGRTLFARALDTPGGLKIQTIHAFCEAVLHRFPLEANIAGHFELLDERMARDLFVKARNGVLADPDEQLTRPLRDLIAGLGESGFDNLMNEAVNDRIAYEVYDNAVGYDERKRSWRIAAGFDADTTEQSLLDSFAPTGPFALDRLQTLHDAAVEAKANRFLKSCLDTVLAAHAAGKNGAVSMEMLASFLKQDHTPYNATWLISGKLRSAWPDIEAAYLDTANEAADVLDKIYLLRAVDQGAGFASVIGTILARYGALKRRGGYLDFTDLIERTVNMLLRDDVGAWVRYKLDAGIDHVLVDEAQDTSALQWQLIRRLTSDFFSGETAKDHGRTVFAVGDEKQSIYSFQGADPEQFGHQRDYFGQAATDVQAGFHAVRLPASFRSTDAVLSAVDRVFAFDSHAEGVRFDTASVQHLSLRKNQPGRVELWEPVQTETVTKDDDWLAPYETAIDGPSLVAKRIADDIKRRMNDGYVLDGLGRVMRAGDVLVLVRNRTGPFVHALSRELKARGIAVAGADRLDMMSHPATLDLLALARLMLDPDDDLSLAELIKSPLLNGDDDDLIALATGRSDSQTLLQRLKAEAGQSKKYASWITDIQKWRIRAANQPLFEFFAYLLSVDGGRKKLVARLGPETPDIVDEFLNETMAMAQSGTATLQEFVRSFETGAREIKREMDQNAGQVRIMTVHGAKGLEAPVVYLIDPGTPPAGRRNPESVKVASITPESELGAAPLLLVPAESSQRPSMFADQLLIRKQADAREYRRLLYVGMTRAADELIITGYRGAASRSKPDKDPAERSWFEMAKYALVDSADAPASALDAYGFNAWCYETQMDASASEPIENAVEPVIDAAPDIAWMRTPAPVEPPAPRPLAPSGASVLAVEHSDANLPRPEPATEPQKSVSLVDRLLSNDDDPSNQAMARAARRGTAMHALIDYLTDVPPLARYQLAHAWFETHGWAQHEANAMVHDVMAVLDHALMADVRGTHTRSEVSIMGTIEVHGQSRAVSGVIDRLVVAPDHVRVIDFKTNLRPPMAIKQVPSIYVTQLALYRALIAPLYPRHTLKCTLIFTTGPVSLDIPDAMMDASLGHIAAA